MAVFDTQHPLTLCFGILGNFLSICGYLDPLPTFIKIYKQKSTTELRSLPYMATLFSLLLWIYYGLICEGDERFLLITVKLVGSFIESVYITIIYLRATPDEKKKTKKIICLMMVGHVVASFVTFILSRRWRRADIVGLICAGVSLCLLTEELTIVVQVVKTKSSEFISFTSSFWLTLSSMMWFLCGLFMVDLSVMVANVFGFTLGVTQLMLYECYKPSKPHRNLEQCPADVPQHIINILPTFEEYPADSPPSSHNEPQMQEGGGGGEEEGGGGGNTEYEEGVEEESNKNKKNKKTKKKKKKNKKKKQKRRKRNKRRGKKKKRRMRRSWKKKKKRLCN